MINLSRGESRRRSTLAVPRRQSVVSRRSSVGIDDTHLSTVTTSNNIDEILKAEDLPKINTLRIFKTNGKEWHYILMGSLASVVMGASMPVYAFLFGEVVIKSVFTNKLSPMLEYISGNMLATY